MIKIKYWLIYNRIVAIAITEKKFKHLNNLANGLISAHNTLYSIKHVLDVKGLKRWFPEKHSINCARLDI